MLASKNRFHRRNHVNNVHKHGTAIRGRDISLKFRINERDKKVKIAVVVSKKVAKSAVVRNRIRRRVFEIVRTNIDLLPEGFEGVFGVFSASIADTPHTELEKNIKTLMNKTQKQ